jgi:hypothetical protein
MVAPMKIKLFVFLQVIQLILCAFTAGHSEFSKEEMSVVVIASAIVEFQRENPNEELVEISQLHGWLDPALVDHRSSWLPLTERYAFLRTGQGVVKGVPGGDEGGRLLRFLLYH